jgi:hypothetical protein
VREPAARIRLEIPAHEVAGLVVEVAGLVVEV